MAKFRKKPVVIEAFQWDGAVDKIENYPEWVRAAMTAETIYFIGHLAPEKREMQIKTLEGVMRASPGDWIIKGVMGEFYPIKNQIFIETYEPVSEHES